MGSEAERQAAWILPPVKNSVAVIAVTATAATTDISSLTSGSTYLAIQADGAAVYVAIGVDNTVDVDETAVGVPATKGCAKIPDGAVLNIKPMASLHKFIAAKTSSGSAKLRVWVTGPDRTM